MYYNYRHYNPIDGRWCGRDPVEALFNLYSLSNNVPFECDFVGLFSVTRTKDGDSQGRRFKGHITTFGVGVDWNLTWGFSFDIEDDDTICSRKVAGKIFMGGDVGVTFGPSKMMKLGGVNIFFLAGIRGFVSLQASSEFSFTWARCGRMSDLYEIKVSSVGLIGFEGGILARYWIGNSRPRETGVGIRGSISVGLTLEVVCTGKTCATTSIIGLQEGRIDAFLSVHNWFEISKNLAKKDNFNWMFKETAYYENPFIN